MANLNEVNNVLALARDLEIIVDEEFAVLSGKIGLETRIFHTGSMRKQTLSGLVLNGFLETSSTISSFQTIRKILIVIPFGQFVGYGK